MSHTNSIDDIMFGRHSIRKYDTRKKIAKAEMAQILADATSAPSSLNMQSWRFVVIESTKAKKNNQVPFKIKSIAMANVGCLNLPFWRPSTSDKFRKNYARVC